MVPPMKLSFIIMVRNLDGDPEGRGSGQMPTGTHSIMFHKH